jgi:threonine/homoserine/homoserine lactone efflux protein
MALLMFLLSIFIQFLLPKDSIQKGLLLVLLSYLLIIIIITAIQYFNKNIICLQYLKDRPSFLNKNKDNIIVNLLCALLGTVIGGLIIYLITKY